MATTNAAKAGGVPERSGRLVPGDRADLIQYDFDSSDLTVTIKATYVSGEKVYAGLIAGGFAPRCALCCSILPCHAPSQMKESRGS